MEGWRGEGGMGALHGGFCVIDLGYYYHDTGTDSSNRLM
jgi:hypothetical protein